MEPEKEGGSPVPPSSPEGGSENEAFPFGELAPRLELAIAQAGGPSAVARRAAMYPSTLHRYRAGRELPSSALVSLARATGVRLEWLATGEGPMQGEHPVVTAPAAPPGYVLLPLVEAQNLALLTASGDSMDPTIRDGDLLLVDISARRIEGSRIYVLAIGGALMVKRIQLRLDGSVVVKSDNTIYESEVVPADQTSTLNILGQVIWQAGPVRS